MSSTPCKVVSQKEKTCPIKLCRNLDHDGIIVYCPPFSQHFFHQQRSPKRRPSILFLFNEGKERVYPVSVLWFLNNFLNDAIARCFHLHSQLRCDLRVQKSLEVNRVRTMITDSSQFSSFLYQIMLHLGFPAQTTTGSGSGAVQVASAYTCTTH